MIPKHTNITRRKQTFKHVTKEIIRGWGASSSPHINAPTSLAGETAVLDASTPSDCSTVTSVSRTGVAVTQDRAVEGLVAGSDRSCHTSMLYRKSHEPGDGGGLGGAEGAGEDTDSGPAGGRVASNTTAITCGEGTALDVDF